VRVERRLQPSPAALALASLGAIAFTLAVSSVLVVAAGAPVGRTYGLLLQGAFGSVFAWSETLTRAVPLMLTGLAAAVAFRARLFNIGAEGQLLMGAIAATWAGTRLAPPAALHLPLVLGAGMLAGALWAGIAAVLRVRRDVPEVLSTLLLNFVAVQAVAKIPRAQTLELLKDLQCGVRDFTPADFASFDGIADFLADQKITPTHVDYRKSLQLGFYKG
jgi:simple sugar transport system permease protein